VNKRRPTKLRENPSDKAYGVKPGVGDDALIIIFSEAQYRTDVSETECWDRITPIDQVPGRESMNIYAIYNLVLNFIGTIACQYINYIA
jgi:hypothetical protein